ncbi:MAG: hypothetical protein HRU26_09170 [Psychroserpens sp.]|nr:hypothetical protein [Psychroserpens sp.]
MENITPNQNTFSNFEDEKANLKQEFRKYLRYWPWFAFALIISVISAYIYIRYAPRIYVTNAKIKILDESEGLELPTSAFIFKRSNINLENEIEILTSYRILKKVAYQQKLNTIFYEEGTIITSQIAELPFNFDQLVAPDSIGLGSRYSIDVDTDAFEVTNLATKKITKIPNHDSYAMEHDLPFEISKDSSDAFKKSFGKRYLVNFTVLNNATLALKSKLGVGSIGEQSDLLNLSMRGESTLLSERILNTLIAVFDNDGIKDRQLVSQRTLDFIDDRFIFLAQELDSIEIDRKEFKERNNLVNLEVDAQVGLELRSRSDEELFAVENQIALVGMLQNALETNIEGGLLPANIGLENPNINIMVDFLIF